VVLLMAFKSSSSFLRFVTMGASGVRQTLQVLRSKGFSPIELERYSSSNKIWATKIKRLRMPDLLCVRTGLRVEVKAKSDLAIKMSHASNNVDRAWDAGMRDEDLIAFVACREEDGHPRASEEVNFFATGALRASRELARLGPPKSAADGAERDLEWPSYVAQYDGEVLEAPLGNGAASAGSRLRLRFEPSPGVFRTLTYNLRGKVPYVRSGDRFRGCETILAAVPTGKADLTQYLRRHYDPIAELTQGEVIDRYAAIKALPHRAELGNIARDLLVSRIREESDARVRLEAAGSAARFGAPDGERFLRDHAMGDGPADLRMEAVFILTELRTNLGPSVLLEVANAPDAPTEIRQAAVWGLGFAGHERYDLLLPYLDDEDENVALHAISAFGPHAPPHLVRELVHCLDERNPRLAAASSQALLMIDSDLAIDVLASVLHDSYCRTWALVSLGQFAPMRVRARVRDEEALQAVAPLLRAFSDENWLATGDRPEALSFLLGQRF
jgi:hypothetical protein